MEGSTKGFLAIVFAILLVVSIAFWPQTKFVARFLSDLIVMNGRTGLQSLLEYLHQHSPFAHQT
jgi:hypothetical protein